MVDFWRFIYGLHPDKRWHRPNHSSAGFMPKTVERPTVSQPN